MPTVEEKALSDVADVSVPIESEDATSANGQEKKKASDALSSTVEPTGILERSVAEVRLYLFWGL